MHDKFYVKVDGVPVMYQYPQLPTGCEATSLAMLLNWADQSVSKDDVAAKLPKGKKVKWIDGGWYGANPNQQFVGDPYTDSDDGSFGVFEKPILATIEMFMPGKGVNLTGQEFNDLLAMVHSGKPVLAWTTLKQNQTYYTGTWQDETGRTIDWYHYEHAVVITGIDEGNVIVHDPDTGKEEYYDKTLFKQNWISMGKRAVTLDLSVHP